MLVYLVYIADPIYGIDTLALLLCCIIKMKVLFLVPKFKYIHRFASFVNLCPQAHIYWSYILSLLFLHFFNMQIKIFEVG